MRVQSIIDPFEIDDSDSDSEPVGWMNTVPAVADERDSSDSEPVGEMDAASVEAEVQNDGNPEPVGWMDAVPAGVEDQLYSGVGEPTEVDQRSDVSEGSADDSGTASEVGTEQEHAEQQPRCGGLRNVGRRDYRALHKRGTTDQQYYSNIGRTAYFARAVRSDLGGKLNAYHITVNEAMRTMLKPALNSIVKEVINIWGNGKNMHPVSVKSLTRKQKRSIIRSCLFLKEKFLPTGDFEKLKSRLVALGNMQDTSTYTSEETGSPTVSLLSLFALLAVLSPFY